MEANALPPSRRWVQPYVSPFDPCPPIGPVSYETPIQLFLGFQPPGMEQFSPIQALAHGTLWPGLYSPYTNPYQENKKG